MTPREAARALGGEASGPHTLLCPGPNHGPRDRSLSVRLEPGAPGGFVVHSFAGDDPLACRDHVRQLLGLGDWRERRDDMPTPRPRPKPVGASDEGARIVAARRLWREARHPAGTLVERYIAGRGLELDPIVAGEAIRYHPALRLDGGTAAGMVCLLRDLRSDTPCGIHRTFLDDDGRKVDRKMLGRAAGAAIKLDPDDNVELGLVVAEGVESGMAARALGYRPCWAVGSAGAIRTLPVLGGIEGLTILGETDDGGANAQAAQTCARRWAAAGCDVEVLEPLVQGDANDVLRARAENG